MAAVRFAGVMLAAISKVFVVDTAHLHDLYRVLSLLGYVYQRFVFKTPGKTEPVAEETIEPSEPPEPPESRG